MTTTTELTGTTLINTRARKVQTTYELATLSDAERVLAILTTYHHKDRKCYGSTLTRLVEEDSVYGKVQRHQLFRDSKTIHSERVARHSAKLLEVAHKAALAKLGALIIDGDGEVKRLLTREVLTQDMEA